MNTLNKYIIPQSTLDTLKRYDYKVRQRILKQYHNKLRVKHNWLVRGLKNDLPYYFYCDGELPQLEGVEIFDCNWTPEEWNTKPYRYFYNPVQKAMYKSYAHHSTPSLDEYDYSFNRGDCMITKNDKLHFMYFNNGTNYARWELDYDLQALTVIHNGFYSVSYNNGEMLQGTHSSKEKVKKVDDSRIIPVLKQMNNKKYNGVYNEMIEEVIARFGVPRNRL